MMTNPVGTAVHARQAGRFRPFLVPLVSSRISCTSVAARTPGFRVPHYVSLLLLECPWQWGTAATSPFGWVVGAFG